LTRANYRLFRYHYNLDHIPYLVHQVWIGCRENKPEAMQSVREFCVDINGVPIIWEYLRILEAFGEDYVKHPTPRLNSIAVRLRAVHKYGGL